MITSDRIKPYLDNFLDIRSLLLYLLGLASRIKDKLFPIADKNAAQLYRTARLFGSKNAANFSLPFWESNRRTGSTSSHSHTPWRWCKSHAIRSSLQLAATSARQTQAETAAGLAGQQAPTHSPNPETRAKSSASGGLCGALQLRAQSGAPRRLGADHSLQPVQQIGRTSLHEEAKSGGAHQTDRKIPARSRASASPSHSRTR
jgi:hypothetical protein